MKISMATVALATLMIREIILRNEFILLTSAITFVTNCLLGPFSFRNHNKTTVVVPTTNEIGHCESCCKSCGTQQQRMFRNGEEEESENNNNNNVLQTILRGGSSNVQFFYRILNQHAQGLISQEDAIESCQNFGLPSDAVRELFGAIHMYENGDIHFNEFVHALGPPSLNPIHNNIIYKSAYGRKSPNAFPPPSTRIPSSS